MFSMRQLRVALDSLEKEYATVKLRSGQDIFSQFNFAKLPDSILSKLNIAKKEQDTSVVSMSAIIPDSAKKNIDQNILATSNSLKSTAQAMDENLKGKERTIRNYKIEWHRKIVLSIACLVLFLIGAPLGAIIRKGGLGTPLIFAILFFMLFYFSSTIGEKFAKENTMTPFTGMWLATFVLVPVGVFLTWKAMRDSQLFNKEYYRKVGGFFRRITGRKVQSKF